MWSDLLSGVRFLTILPLKPSATFDARGAMTFFPVCGLIVGAVLLLVDTAARTLWSDPAAAVIDVVALAVISGALHLDGLADTADGLYGRRAPEQALAIMKDSRIGAMGMVAVACCLALKWVGLSSLHAHRYQWLLLVPAFARASVLFGVRMLPYGRPEGGTGLAFFQECLRLRDFWGFAGLLLLALLLTGWHVAWVVGGFTLLTVLTLLYYRWRVHCITGDMLGAMIEICEAGLFLFLSAVDRPL